MAAMGDAAAVSADTGAPPARGSDAPDLLAGLNPVQREAVTASPEVPLLVVAGARSGKNRGLTPPAAPALGGQRLSPPPPLPVTLTEKAARGGEAAEAHL